MTVKLISERLFLPLSVIKRRQISLIDILAAAVEEGLLPDIYQ
jgi:hypothetical protein